MQKILFIIIGFIVVGAGAFYGGMRYERQKNSSSRQDRQMRMQQFNGASGGGQRGMRGSGDIVIGEILSKDTRSITVKLRDGGSKIILLSETTKIVRSIDASLASLMAGEQVNVTGSANADGSMNAQMIQVRPDDAGRVRGNRTE